MMNRKTFIYVTLAALLLTGCARSGQELGSAQEEFESSEVQESEQVHVAKHNEVRGAKKKNEDYKFVVASDDHVHSWVDKETTSRSDCTVSASVLKECTLCGLQKMETVEGEGHDYVDTVVEATCSSQGYVEHKCKKCGASYISDETALLAHMEASEYEQPVSCEVDGIIKRYCKICREVLGYEQIKHEGHDWYLANSESPCKAGTKNTYICKNCNDTKEVALAGKHEWSDWKELKKATCENEGEKVHTCKVCSKQEKASIAKLNHDLEGWKVLKSATCIEVGNKVRVCKNCGRAVEKENLSMTVHPNGDWITDVPATCTSAGSKHRSCNYCKKIETGNIDKLPHSYQWIVESEATCTTTGKKIHECSECGYIDSTETLPAKGHRLLSDSAVTVKADCTHAGYKKTSCGDCSYIDTVEYPALGHQCAWVTETEATCDTDGKKNYKCSVCDVIEKTESITALGHDWDKGKCKRCGAQDTGIAELQ